jgi:hypothetical protein
MISQDAWYNDTKKWFNPLNAKLNPICHLQALLAHPILHVSRIRAVNTDSVLTSHCHSNNTSLVRDLGSLIIQPGIKCCELLDSDKFHHNRRNDILTNTLSIIVQQDATLYSFYSLQTALHVSGDTFTHHQECK